MAFTRDLSDFDLNYVFQDFEWTISNENSKEFSMKFTKILDEFSMSIDWIFKEELQAILNDISRKFEQSLHWVSVKFVNNFE